MLLAVDIGNTNTVLGLFDGDVLKEQFRITSDLHSTTDEYQLLISGLFQNAQVDKAQVKNVIISSVVPQLSDQLFALFQKFIGVRPLIVGPGIKTGVRILTDDPRAVGSDRIVNAAAVVKYYGTPAIVVDFGTATTFDCISEAGDYLGGCISPGISLSLDALVANTAKLPRIEMKIPKHAIGKGTVEAMQSGIVLGYKSLVEGVIDEITQELGEPKAVIATGGLGQMFLQICPSITEYDKSLTLKGLRLISELNPSHTG